MKTLVPAVIITVTAIAVVIGANAVTGERGSDADPAPRENVAADQARPPRPTVDPSCIDDPPDGDQLNCLLFSQPERPDVTPRGFKEIECEVVPREELEEFADAAPVPEMDENYCIGAQEGSFYVPDYGPNLPTVAINGQVVELPEDVVISPPGIGEPAVGAVSNESSEEIDPTPWVGWTTVISGESWVKYTTNGRLLDSHIASGDEGKFQALIDALDK